MTDENAPATEVEETAPAGSQADSGNTENSSQPRAPRKTSRGEKKMREALLKHNLKQIENVLTVFMRKPPQLHWQFEAPEVFVLDNVYVVFGEPVAQSPGQQAVKDLKTTAAAEEAPIEAAPKIVEDVEAGDATGLKEEDITTIMAQASVSRARAIEALNESGGDLVTAVMNLTL
jgi:nascent polypeptide-associated complex subunit alpha